MGYNTVGWNEAVISNTDLLRSRPMVIKIVLRQLHGSTVKHVVSRLHVLGRKQPGWRVTQPINNFLYHSCSMASYNTIDNAVLAGNIIPSSCEEWDERWNNPRAPREEKINAREKMTWQIHYKGGKKKVGHRQRDSRPCCLRPRWWIHAT